MDLIFDSNTKIIEMIIDIFPQTDKTLKRA